MTIREIFKNFGNQKNIIYKVDNCIENGSKCVLCSNKSTAEQIAKKFVKQNEKNALGRTWLVKSHTFNLSDFVNFGLDDENYLNLISKCNILTKKLDDMPYHGVATILILLSYLNGTMKYKKYGGGLM